MNFRSIFLVFRVAKGDEELIIATFIRYNLFVGDTFKIIVFLLHKQTV